MHKRKNEEKIFLKNQRKKWKKILLEKVKKKKWKNFFVDTTDRTKNLLRKWRKKRRKILLEKNKGKKSKKNFHEPSGLGYTFCKSELETNKLGRGTSQDLNVIKKTFFFVGVCVCVCDLIFTIKSRMDPMDFQHPSLAEKKYTHFCSYYMANLAKKKQQTNTTKVCVWKNNFMSEDTVFFVFFYFDIFPKKGIKFSEIFAPHIKFEISIAINNFLHRISFCIYFQQNVSNIQELK